MWTLEPIFVFFVTSILIPRGNAITQSAEQPEKSRGASLAPRGLLDPTSFQLPAHLPAAAKSYFKPSLRPPPLLKGPGRSRTSKTALRQAQQEPDDSHEIERAKAFWERQFPKPGDPNGEMPFKVFGINPSAPEYLKGPPHMRQRWPECEGEQGTCVPGTDKCHILHNKSVELGRGHEDFGKPCQCVDRDNCAPREGYRTCRCPSRTDESRWDFSAGEPRL